MQLYRPLLSTTPEAYYEPPKVAKERVSTMYTWVTLKYKFELQQFHIMKAHDLLVLSGMLHVHMHKLLACSVHP